MRPLLRKTILMFGILALFFGVIWMLQGNNVFPQDIFSNDPRLFDRGIVLAIAGIIAIVIARRI